MTESCGWQFLLSYFLDVEYPFQGYLFTQMYTTCKHKFRILVHNKLYVVFVMKSATSNLCAIVSTVHYPACACAAGVKQCLHVCICVCVGQKILKNASSMVAKAFTEVLTISVIRLGCFCTWYKSDGFYAAISSTSYHRFRGSTPFKIACGISMWPCYGQQLKYTKIKVYTEAIW